MKALEVRSLTKYYGEFQVLKNVSFSVEPGERRAIIGPNGAGKTTLFNIISGTLKPTLGKIFFFHRDVTYMSAYRRSRLGIGRTFQITNLFFNLSLMDNINLALQISNSSLNLEEFLRSWGFWEKRRTRVGNLSYGEQRQVELLLALAQSPKLILLDEPTAGMSPVETEAITRIITELPRDITILIIEHDMEVVFTLADSITVLHYGQILCEGTKEQVKSDPRVKEVYLGTAGEEV
ncbi:MAG: ABC transporter ATP-binding protein [Thermoanaerobacteraceae bacterium]|nr:ABC transporter ATP-binding protein [Thermoanaerobacteraceae bacterium]